MIQITIHTDEGDSFLPRPGYEVNRILLLLAAQLIDLKPDHESGTVPIVDSNGVQCGTIRMVANEVSGPNRCDFDRCGCHTITGDPIPPPVTVMNHIHVSMCLEFGDQYKLMNDVMKADLIADVHAIMKEDLDAFDPSNAVSVGENAREAAHLLYSRIGGAGNLPDYSTTLGAGPRRGRRRGR